MHASLRTLIGGPRPLVVPGVYDGLSARVVERAGFPAVYVSGGAIARSTGVPDLGLLSMTEVRDRTAQICDAVQVPVLADLDTGYGNALNVFRTVREFARIGVAAVQLEDQVTPKKCGHYAGKELIPAEEMADKVAAATEAGGPDVLVIARTDAVAVEGLAAACRRARSYAAAGADILFVEAPETTEQITAVATELAGHPLLINMFAGGRTPVVGTDRLGELGYRIVIIPSDLQRAAMRAMQDVAGEIARNGDSSRVADHLASFDERDELVRKPWWDARAERTPTPAPAAAAPLS